MFLKILFLVSLTKNLEKVTAKAQRSDTYLDEGKAFNLKPDLWLKTDEKSLIADTKYKIVYSDEKDPKKEFLKMISIKCLLMPFDLK